MSDITAHFIDLNLRLNCGEDFPTEYLAIKSTSAERVNSML